MTEAPWLSVLVPAFKCERTVEETASTILSQADAGVELVFDVAERDDSSRVLASIAKAHPASVRVSSHPDFSDRSTARNDLIAAARGEYFWFVDSDDLVEPGAVSALRGIVERHHPDLVMCDFRDFQDDERGVRDRARQVRTFDGPAEILVEDRDALIRGMFACGHMHAWSKIVRRAVWPATLIFPLAREFEDAPAIARLPLYLRTHYYAARPWIAYRRHRGSGLARMKPEYLEHWLEGHVGYVDEVKAAGITLGDETLFRISDRLTHWFVHACKWSLELEKKSDRLPKLAAQWRGASPLDADALARAYLRRGKILKWAQLRYWMRRAR